MRVTEPFGYNNGDWGVEMYADNGNLEGSYTFPDEEQAWEFYRIQTTQLYSRDYDDGRE